MLSELWRNDRRAEDFRFTALGLALFSAWLQGIYTSLSQERSDLALADLVFPPIGIVHGVGIWFGLW